MRENGLLVHLLLLVRPLIVAVTLSFGVWYFLIFQSNLSYLKIDESPFTDMTVPGLAVFHGFIAGGALSKVWSEYNVIKRCVRKGEKEAFLEALHDRIPLGIHLILGVLSALIMWIVMFLDYRGAGAGITNTFSWALLLTLYWEVATNLDNPITGVWYRGWIPKEWIEEWEVLQKKHHSRPA